MRRKISSFVLILFLISCSSVYKKQDICGSFNIEASKDIKSSAVDFVQIKEDLYKKLELIKSENSKKVCTIILDTTTTTYSEFSNEHGITTGNNVKTKISVEMMMDNKRVFSDISSIFYYKDTISHRYSNYNISLKQDINRSISENVFSIIKTNIDKIDIK